MSGYGVTKLCNILFTRELARRVSGSGVTANCLHPGFVATRFGDGTHGALRAGLAIAKRVFALSPEEGAKTMVYLASSPEVAGRSGGYYARCARPTLARGAERCGCDAVVGDVGGTYGNWRLGHKLRMAPLPGVYGILSRGSDAQREEQSEQNDKGPARHRGRRRIVISGRRLGDRHGDREADTAQRATGARKGALCHSDETRVHPRGVPVHGDHDLRFHNPRSPR